MYLVQVLVEMPVHALDQTFTYLAKEEIRVGVRVYVFFNRRQIIGYVLKVTETDKTQTELEQEAGYRYSYIQGVIDAEPLLNQELQDLSVALAKLTISPQIACLQAMLPPQLKPSTLKTVGIKRQKAVKILEPRIIPRTKKQREAFSYLQETDDLLVSHLPISIGILDNLVKQGAISYYEQEIYREPDPINQDVKKVELTADQQKIVQGISDDFNHYQVSLIHGVTGSGKTEVYLALSQRIIAAHKTVIMLVPEISLTPMMVKAFKERFGKEVAILHSRLSQGERYDEYRRISRQEVKIVVGARSAVFAPLENIGLIIMDEEHDASYKQDSKPRYLTSQVAKIRAQYHKCPVVLGSATPSLESYSRALKGVYKLYQLPKRINRRPLPQIELVDMATEIKRGNYSLFSQQLKDRIAGCLARDEQVILLLNKRGYASYVQCKDCGSVIKCPHCDVTLTYHKASNCLKCHYCEYQVQLAIACPDCHSKDLKLVGSGTQKVAEQLEKMFANAKVIRYDIDSTKNKGGHQKLLAQFERKEGNILLGTQMIAKGLDFPDVTFVGVINADISLNIPDFRSNERTFQLLMQVAGRSGRGDKEGQVVIQTYNPDHFVFKCLKQNSYLNFYHQEMAFRKLALYPPYIHLVSLLIEGKKEQEVVKEADNIKAYLSNQAVGLKVLGPADSLIYKMQDIYRKRIMIKFRDGKKLYPVLNQLTDHYNRQGRKVRLVCDFNPYSQI